jgi:hypothetical protein
MIGPTEAVTTVSSHLDTKNRVERGLGVLFAWPTIMHHDIPCHFQLRFTVIFDRNDVEGNQEDGRWSPLEAD